MSPESRIHSQTQRLCPTCNNELDFESIMPEVGREASGGFIRWSTQYSNFLCFSFNTWKILVPSLDFVSAQGFMPGWPCQSCDTQAVRRGREAPGTRPRAASRGFEIVHALPLLAMINNGWHNIVYRVTLSRFDSSPSWLLARVSLIVSSDHILPRREIWDVNSTESPKTQQLFTP